MEKQITLAAVIFCVVTLWMVLFGVQPPKFIPDGSYIAKKKSYMDKDTMLPYSIYKLANISANSFNMTPSTPSFKAPSDFADVGDYIVYTNGMLIAVSK